jgi:RHS repeat-associated protein
MRLDSSYALQFAGSCSDYHVVYENDRTKRTQKLPADGMGWPYPGNGNTLNYDTTTLYYAWDRPRLKQIVGRDLLADITYNADHYGGYTVKIYRRPTGSAAPPPGQVMELAGMTLIRTWAFSHAGGSSPHPTNLEKLEVAGSSDEKYEIQANEAVPNRFTYGSAWIYYRSWWWWQIEGTWSWTLKLSQGANEKIKKEITILNPSSGSGSERNITLRDSLDGQLVKTVTSKTLDPFSDGFPQDWVITAAGKTITGAAPLGDPQDRATRYGTLPTSVSIKYGGIQPDADYAWDDKGLLSSFVGGSWSTSGSMEGSVFKQTHKRNGSPVSIDWVELLDGGKKVKTYSAPDGTAGGKADSSVAWSEVEYGTATNGLPGLPLIVKNSDGSGATFDWNANQNGSYILTLTEGKLSGSSVSGGTKVLRDINVRGQPNKIEFSAANGGDLKTGGTLFSNFTQWGMPKIGTDFNTSLTSNWSYANDLSRLSSHTSILGVVSEFSGYDVIGRPATVSNNGISAAMTYNAFSQSANFSGAVSGSTSETRDTLGRLTASSLTWGGVTDSLSLTHASESAGINRTNSLLGTFQTTLRPLEGTVASASGPTLPFGGTTGTVLSVEAGLMKSQTQLSGQSATFQTTWTDAWGRIRKTTTPTASGNGTTEYLYSDAASSLKRVCITEPNGRKTITESDPYDTAGAVTRSGIDVDGNGTLGTTDRYVESTTRVSAGKLVTTLKLNEDGGLREILRTEWSPNGNQTVTKINGIEEIITRTPNYTAKTVTTTSTKGWTKTESFNNLGLTTGSALSGAGIPSATLTPSWRVDGSLSGVTFATGGNTHSATFNTNGTLATLNAPGKGNILGGHSISGGSETLTVDGVTTVTKLDGTQTTTSGSDVIGKTTTTATNGLGFRETTHPGLGADTTVDLHASGAPTAKNYAAGNGEGYTYASGLLSKITLARGGDLTLGYTNDGAKDLNSATWPALASGVFTLPTVTQSYSYDRAGRVKSIGDSSGVRLLVYQNGRAAATVWTSGGLAGYKITKNLDVSGREIGFNLYRGDTLIHSAVIAPNGASGEISEISSGTFNATYGRNTARNLTAITRGPVTQNWTRELGGRITAATSSVIGAPAFTYSGFDAKVRRLTSATSGGIWTYQYSNGQLISAVHPTLGSFSYGFDGIGRRTDNGSVNTSDLLNRTLAWTNNQNKALKVTAAPAASVWVGFGTAAATQIPNFTGNYSYPVPSPGASGGWVAWNALAVLAGQGDAGANPDAKAEQSGAVWIPPVTDSFSYDAAGNRQSTAHWDLGWDGKNQLVRARTKNYDSAPQGYDITNSYDAEGRRFSKKVNRWLNGKIVEQKNTTFLHDGNDLIYESYPLPGGLTLLERKYVWGPDISGTQGGAGGAGGLLLIRETKGTVTTDLYPLYDGSGNVIALSDETGALQAEYAYGPFGELIYARGPKAASCPFRFATKYYDQETGFYNFGKRFYDPVTGQFLSREPLGEKESLNLYSYCGNDPINYVDVDGMKKIDLRSVPQFIPVPGLAGRFQVWFSVIEGGKSGDWENIGFYPSSVLIGAATKLRIETDSAYRTRQGIQAMRSMGDQELLAGELELLKIKEDTATLLPGGHAAVAISREQYGAAAAWIVGEGMVATVGGELLGRGLSYGGKAGYLMATGSTLAESRLILGLSKELATGALTSGTPLAAAPLYAPANFVSRTLAASDSGGTSFLETYAFSAAKQSTQTTVLGENMRQRVIPFATKTNARTLPFGTTSAQWLKMTFQQRWKLNDGALRARINDGDLFRYIGQDPFRNPLLRQEFDLTGSELLRLNDRGIPFQIVSPQEVMSLLGHP